MTGNNELRSDDSKTIPVNYTATLVIEKSGTARLFQFGLFKDRDGNGFQKIDGSDVRDVTNRAGAITVRKDMEAENNSLFTMHTRNMENTDNIDFLSLGCDILKD